MVVKEGNLEAPKREAIPWQEDDFTDPASVDAELERVFDICHGCRRCVNLCNAFPTLFDLVDESDTFEVDGVDKADYKKVVDNCYLCDICAETKCPYLPPHEWAVDFPHLMLRAKARFLKEERPAWHTRLLTNTQTLFSIGTKPGIAPLTNAILQNHTLRKLGSSVAKVHPKAPIPSFQSPSSTKSIADPIQSTEPQPTEDTTGRVAIYVTCYGDAFDTASVNALATVLAHNGISVKLLRDAHCCGMPKFEQGDIEAVARKKDLNLPIFLQAIEEGYDLLSVVPSCTLMHRQEMPLLFPEDEQVKKVADAFFDPFEYLWLRHRASLLNLDFKNSLGRVSYHAACHQRVQNIGYKTMDVLSLIPDTDVDVIERCSGHGGTHAIRHATYESAMKIARPATRALAENEPDTFGSDCPIAGRLIVHGLEGEMSAEHPIQMLARAYGLG